MSGKYTLASIAWRKRQRNHRLLFGAPDREIRLGWHNKFAAFLPGQIFGYERWRANKYGTIQWQVFVLQSQTGKGPVSLVPGIFPGASLLASAHGKPNSKRMLSSFDGLKEKGDLASLTSGFWVNFGTLFEAGFDAPKLIAMED